MSGSRLKCPGTTADGVLARVVEAILRGRFPGGTPLCEAQLARQWKVSRTPMREAARRAGAGLALWLARWQYRRERRCKRTGTTMRFPILPGTDC